MQTIIQSRDNPLYRRIRRVLDGVGAARAQRRGEASVVLEGVHLCQMWLRHVGEPEYAVFDAQALQRHAEIAALYEQLACARRALLSPALAVSLSQVARGPGIYFLAHAPRRAAPQCITESTLCLDRIQDPGNVGTLLRTAAAAGVSCACLGRGSASAWSNKALRAGQGAQFAMTIFEDVELLPLCQNADLPILATALVDAVPLYTAKLPQHCLWLFGNEGQGVAPELLRLADLRLTIVQSTAVESLNVAAAAAVCLFEQRRQHALSG